MRTAFCVQWYSCLSTDCNISTWAKLFRCSTLQHMVGLAQSPLCERWHSCPSTDNNIKSYKGKPFWLLSIVAYRGMWHKGHLSGSNDTGVLLLLFLFRSKIPRISNKDHVTNEEVRAKIQQAIGSHKDLLTTIKRHKLQWYGHASCSSGLAKTILQGTVKGGRRQGRQRKRWEDNIREWTDLEFGRSQRAVENREKVGKLVAKSSVVPQRLSRLRDRWWWWWLYWKAEGSPKQWNTKHRVLEVQYRRLQRWPHNNK